MPTKSDSDVIFCLQFLTKTLTCTLILSKRQSIYHLCINPILWIGLIHKCSVDSKSLITSLTKQDATVTLGWQGSTKVNQSLFTSFSFVCCLKIICTTVVPIKSDSNIILCLQLLSKKVTCALSWSSANR